MAAAATATAAAAAAAAAAASSAAHAATMWLLHFCFLTFDNNLGCLGILLLYYARKAFGLSPSNSGGACLGVHRA